MATCHSNTGKGVIEISDNWRETIMEEDNHRKITYCKHIGSEQNGHCGADDIFKCIFLNENKHIFGWLSLKFVDKVRLMIGQHRFM